MAKPKLVFVCSECGASQPKWSGRCPACNEWNTLRQMAVATETGVRSAGERSPTVASTALADIDARPAARLTSQIGELDRVLGGGFVPGAAVLLAGEPGIGKSTLALLASARLALPEHGALYVAAEESPPQIKLRAERMGLAEANVVVLGSTDVGTILEVANAHAPRALAVDSIQAVALAELDSLAGSVSQVRESASRLLHWAKSANVPLLLVGHVTKTGSIAGPRVLEHLVDAVLYLEGDRYHAHRLLRGLKNRFGATNEIGVFEMVPEGLAEVPDPSAIFLAERAVGAPGSAVTVAMEGSRPLLCEVQALVGEQRAEAPQRSANGLDYRRLLMISAVLAQRTGLQVAGRDVFVNVVGGLRVYEPAADLAMASAIASSLTGRPLPADLVIMGEIGLSGETRSVPQLERRLGEAMKLGFRQAVVPAQGRRRGQPIEGLVIHQARTVNSALQSLL